MLGERPRASNHRASFAVLLGLVAVLVVPGAVAVARQSPSIRLIDASWGIPVAAALGFLTLGLTNLAGVRIQWTVGRAGGAGRARAARFLGRLAICIAVTASISVGVYELLLRFEQ